ncbi:hypothetical protein AB2T63_18825 [Clostridium butyricum]|uniref:Uncharacterized protein n=1 Tax=Clostridium butyricum TaxID=1492 RepID=A0A6L9EQM3_CLOBU|nr:hypothetical protein [Clostridium butyricum]MDU1509586.1 hypothetical protein [Clostridium butyricum]MDU4802351.1 hypothetical protein [Clostridium butyricum]MDU5723679.1 hypothetical protein [Clostridium butyricum]NAS18802.1 hypothetical protein [Clostridium butyricum]
METATDVMEDKDFNVMSDFMKNITDNQYNKLIDILKNNGYGNLAQMM